MLVSEKEKQLYISNNPKNQTFQTNHFDTFGSFSVKKQETVTLHLRDITIFP